jgi:hypothetical protein
MSGQKVAYTRLPIRAAESQRRSVALMLVRRFPGIWRRFARAFQARLRPRSRLRQLVLRRLAGVGYAAYNRRDFEALKPFFAEKAKVYPPPNLVFDLDPVYHGPDGFVRAHELWHEAWGSWKTRPEVLLDLGASLLSIARVETEGAASGLPLASWACNLYEIEDGLIVSERVFLDRAEALEAVGLSE